MANMVSSLGVSSSTPATSASIAVTISDQHSISLFNRGQITTIFTPPPSCLSTLTFGGAMYFGHWVHGYVDPACYPSSTWTKTATSEEWEIYYYSPARCPSGWSNAKTVTGTTFGQSSKFLSLGSATTAVICCPSGYSSLNNDHACQSVLNVNSSTILYIKPTLSGSIWQSTGSTDAHSGSVSTAYTIYGDGIPVWWQSSDSSNLFAATKISPASTAATEPSTTSIKPTSTPTSPPAPIPPNGLTNGAKIGVGIGIPLAAIVIGVVAFFIYSRRQRRNWIAETELQDISSSKPPSLEQPKRGLLSFVPFRLIRNPRNGG